MIYRLSDKSALLPTSTTITSFPRSDRTSSIHFDVDKNDCRSACASVGVYRRSYGQDSLVISKTTMATVESRMYDGMSERKRS